MASGKESFKMYTDQIHLFKTLTDDEAGKLIKHVFEYVNDLNPITDNRIIEISFEPIKRQLKRDLKKYVDTCTQNKENISKRWNKKDTTEYDDIQPNTNDTDKIRKDKIRKDINNEFDIFWDLYNKKIDKTKCIKKWRLLKDEEKEKIVKVLDSYVKSTPDVKFRKNPLTWLNGKCWDDEIIIQNPKKNNSLNEGYLIYPPIEKQVNPFLDPDM